MLKLVTYPDKRLNMKSSPIESWTDGTKAFAKNLGRLMLQSGGVGISAPQVGIMKRIIIVSDPRFGLVAMANPEITEYFDEKVASIEGCLSFPGKAAVVYRHPIVKVRYLSVDNEMLELELDKEAASIVAHEIDHLDGVTMVERNKEAQRELKRRGEANVNLEIKTSEPRSEDSDQSSQS